VLTWTAVFFFAFHIVPMTNVNVEKPTLKKIIPMNDIDPSLALVHPTPCQSAIKLPTALKLARLHGNV
jgi:hypothetical protein